MDRIKYFSAVEIKYSRYRVVFHDFKDVEVPDADNLEDALKNAQPVLESIIKNIVEKGEEFPEVTPGVHGEYAIYLSDEMEDKINSLKMNV